MAFTKLGYHTWLPEQDGGELPDGVAEAPIDVTNIDPDVSANEFVNKVEENKQRLKEEYPAVWNLAGADDLSVEAETSTIKYPFQTFHNLRKAKERGDLCVFAVKDMSAKKDDFAYWARRGEQTIYETERAGRGVRIIDDTVTFRKHRDKNGNPRYYNDGDAKYKIKSGEKALRPKTDQKGTTWYYDTEADEVVAAPSTTGSIPEDADEIRFESEEAVIEGDPTAVPAYFEYDSEAEEFIVHAGSEKLYYGTKAEMKSEWETFNPPFIPQAEFDEMPTKDDFIIVVFPDKDSEYDQPQIYDRGELTPMFDALGADLTMPELDGLEELPDGEIEGGQGTDTDTETVTDVDDDAGDGAVEGTNQPEPPAESRPDGDSNESSENTSRPTTIGKHSANDYTTEQVATFATGTALPRDAEFERFVSAVKAVDPAVAAAIDEPDDIPDVVGVSSLEEEVAAEQQGGEQQAGTPDLEATRVESSPGSDIPTAECPGCGEASTFSEGGQWDTLTCDRCGYTPKASVREEIAQGDKSDQDRVEASTDVGDTTSAGGSGQEEHSNSGQEAKGVDSTESDSTSQFSKPAGIPYDCPECDQEQLFSRDDGDTFTCDGCGYEPIVRVQNHLDVERRLGNIPAHGGGDTDNGEQEPEEATNTSSDDEPASETEQETDRVESPEPPEPPESPESPEPPEPPEEAKAGESPKPPEPPKELMESEAPNPPKEPEVPDEPKPPEAPQPPESPKPVESTQQAKPEREEDSTDDTGGSGQQGAGLDEQDREGKNVDQEPETSTSRGDDSGEKGTMDVLDGL